MKKIAAVVVAGALAMCMFGCSGGSESGNQEPSGGEVEQEAEKKEPLSLVGTWEQTNKNSEDSYQMAVIDESTITVYWVSDGGDTKSLYWAGSYVAPTDAVDEYEWASENDKEQTSKAFLASGDDTKDFAYKNGELSYEVSAMGTTTTVRMALQE